MDKKPQKPSKPAEIDRQVQELSKLRNKIDEIDEQILDALNRRARVVLDVARIKRSMGAKFYVPHREQQIVDRLKKLNKGPFPNVALRPLYREIMSASLAMEEPLKVAFLGPEATFSHLAAQRHFGTTVSFMPVRTIRNVFETVEAGKSDFGVVPIENSNEGMVTYTMDMLMETDLKIHAEIMIEVVNNLLSSSGDIGKIKTVYSHPQPLAQCRGWLEANLPGVKTVETSSTTKAAEIAASDPDAAAISSELAAKMYDLHFVEKNIQDNKRNYTRFLVIASESPPRTGHDKTSVMFSVKNKPGALFDILMPFKTKRINLTKIESRPSKRKAWEYIFFLDLEGHADDKKIRAAIDEMAPSCFFLKILGSYPSAESGK